MPRRALGHASRELLEIVDLTKGPTTIEDIHHRLRYRSRSAVAQTIYRLRDKKLVRRTNKGGRGAEAFYSITPAGRRKLATERRRRG